jgi:DNA-binding MarR family transcriptional regulator
MTEHISSNAEPAKDLKTSFAPANFYASDNYVAGGDSVAYLMSRVVTAFTQEIERQFEPSGLTNAQWKPLFKLAYTNTSTVAELARQCTLDAGGMTRLLDRLEAKGLCQRERSEQDRRVVNLALTDAGREAVKDIPVVLSRVHNSYLAGFSHEEWQTLKSFLQRILDNAQAVQAEAHNTVGEKNAP